MVTHGAIGKLLLIYSGKLDSEHADIQEVTTKYADKSVQNTKTKKKNNKNYNKNKFRHNFYGCFPYCNIQMAQKYVIK